MRCAEAFWCVTRSDSVSSPFSNVHALNGLSAGPVWRISFCTGSSM